MAFSRASNIWQNKVLTATRWLDNELKDDSLKQEIKTEMVRLRLSGQLKQESAFLVKNWYAHNPK